VALAVCWVFRVLMEIKSGAPGAKATGLIRSAATGPYCNQMVKTISDRADAPGLRTGTVALRGLNVRLKKVLKYLLFDIIIAL
jgi:hypothetical protein